MTRRVRAPVSRLRAGVMCLDASTGHYLTRVLRLKPGDEFIAFDVASATEADAVVGTEREGGQLDIEISVPKAAAVQATVDVALVQGLAKGDKCDAIVRDATELGATRIVFAACDRSIVRLDATKASLRLGRWEKIAVEAARQAGRGDGPRVVGPFDWEKALDVGGEDNAARFCLYEGATVPLGPLLVEASQQGKPLVFAVGPEGGLTDGEVATAERKGYRVVSLGPFVLRTETVAAAVLGAAGLVRQLPMLPAAD